MVYKEACFSFGGLVVCWIVFSTFWRTSDSRSWISLMSSVFDSMSLASFFTSWMSFWTCSCFSSSCFISERISSSFLRIFWSSLARNFSLYISAVYFFNWATSSSEGVCSICSFSGVGVSSSYSYSGVSTSYKSSGVSSSYSEVFPSYLGVSSSYSEVFPSYLGVSSSYSEVFPFYLGVSSSYSEVFPFYLGVSSSYLEVTFEVNPSFFGASSGGTSDSGNFFYLTSFLG